MTEEASDFTSIHWYGKLKAPSSEDFTFIFNGDDGFRFYLDHQLLVDRWESCCDEMQIVLTLREGQFYDLVLEFKEMQEIAYLSLEWTSPSILRQLIPPTAFYYSQRVQNQVYQITVEKGPSIPANSTIETTPTEIIAGKLYESTF